VGGVHRRSPRAVLRPADHRPRGGRAPARGSPPGVRPAARRPHIHRLTPRRKSTPRRKGRSVPSGLVPEQNRLERGQPCPFVLTQPPGARPYRQLGKLGVEPLKLLTPESLDALSTEILVQLEVLDVRLHARVSSYHALRWPGNVNERAEMPEIERAPD